MCSLSWFLDRLPHVVVIAFLAALGMVLCCCTPTPTATPPPVSLMISGSTEMAPLLTSLADRFQTHHPSTTVIIRVGNSVLGMEQVVNGTAELGAISLFPPDADRMSPAEIWAVPIAVDGIAIVVHSDNPVQNLTLAQVQDILSGRLWRWSDLGVEAAEDEITVVSREKDSGTRAMFEATVMVSELFSGTACQPTLALDPGGNVLLDTGLCESVPVTPMAVLMPSSTAVVGFIATHPGAIGYVSQGHLSRRIKAVALEGTLPALENIAGGSYHLARPFYFVALGEPEGAAREFVDFCLGEEGQAIVAQRYGPVRAKQ